MSRRIVKVNPAHVNAAKLRIELDKEDGLETPAAVVLIANARPAGEVSEDDSEGSDGWPLVVVDPT